MKIEVGAGVIVDNFLSGLSQSMRKDLNKILLILKEYNAKRVIVYGSLARGDYREDSDIDICVEGMPSSNFFRVLGKCLMGSDHSVSIVDLEGAEGYFRDRILKEGKVIYEHD